MSVSAINSQIETATLAFHKTQRWIPWLASLIHAPESAPPPLTEKHTNIHPIPDLDEEFVILSPKGKETVPESGLWGTLGYTKEVINELSHSSTTLDFEENKEAIQQELSPFFEQPEIISYQDVKEYISLLNETYPDYAIDPNKPLLSEIRRTKMAMIERGEKGFENGVGLYAFFSPDARETMVKIATYQRDRTPFQQDIDYQQRMLSSFKFFTS